MLTLQSPSVASYDLKGRNQLTSPVAEVRAKTSNPWLLVAFVVGRGIHYVVSGDAVKFDFGALIVIATLLHWRSGLVGIKSEARNSGFFWLECPPRIIIMQK